MKILSRLIGAIPLLLISTCGFTIPNKQKGLTFGPSSLTTTYANNLQNFQDALDGCKEDITKTCRVRVGSSSIETTGRMGLIATTDIKKGDVVLSMPYDDMISLTPATARNVVYKSILPDAYDGWTGDNGLIALLILNEVARAADEKKGVAAPKRTESLQAFMKAWLELLPSLEECKTLHPLLWPEADQEVLQSSSTSKIYQILDDIEEDATWLTERLWSANREVFPEEVTWNGDTIPCFSQEGYKWAMALVTSRSVFTDNSLRVIPLLDFANHDDKGREVEGGKMGAFATTSGALLYANKDYKAGEELLCSYGPKSASDYVLENGFCPPKAVKTAVSELTFELDPEDAFYEDKIDILEFETYDQKPIDPVQPFDLVSEPGRDGEPDPAMLQFLRLTELGGTDAFLLESIFRQEVWGFMSMPVSEANEAKVVNRIIDACSKSLDELASGPSSGPEMCKTLCEIETKALTKTVEYFKREKEALDLKEYYQQRRLKDLGLDSEWVPEDGIVDPDSSAAQTRLPGSGLDW
mmetsp:Transcript_30018/g.44377  ORF Transcript_30018/g.44377 Transcript_30018/m.44377 type:complete len:527 (-) Transcript_30018:1865-3445(-)|eukprot:CAMPEP_0194209204 /NCGR_PEP_ID=MMETSP0156-20130528/7415_1 /TAXON_ID=33649 /ORGANISM="Thalassionema nitzschioides, Strain L26-B" /LENGTH=526 /DNA_ID=CAMNT_0038936335 /DNA_START=125 /DNA_END=1705 /DNA_ORIENTATION=-